MTCPRHVNRPGIPELRRSRPRGRITDGRKPDAGPVDTGRSTGPGRAGPAYPQGRDPLAPAERSVPSDALEQVQATSTLRAAATRHNSNATLWSTWYQRWLAHARRP